MSYILRKKNKVKSIFSLCPKETVRVSGWVGKTMFFFFSFVFKVEEDEISLLEEELIKLSVKNSIVSPSEDPSLVCSIWTKKLFNPNSFRAQMKSIWKTQKKF